MAVRITVEEPDVGLIAPDEAELERLYEIVGEAHPWLMTTDRGRRTFTAADLALAFQALGGFYRRPTTDRTRYFYHWVDIARERVGERLNPTALLAACILDGVRWQKHEPEMGALLELGLDPFQGGLSDNVWQKVLRGAPIPDPVPPRAMPGHAAGLPTFSAY